MNWRENVSRSKEVLGAYWRQGLHELGSVFYGHGTAAQHPEYGMIGTRPPGLVTEGLRPDRIPDVSRDEPGPSALEAHLQQAKSRDAPEPGREPERDDRTEGRE